MEQLLLRHREPRRRGEIGAGERQLAAFDHEMTRADRRTARPVSFERAPDSGQQAQLGRLAQGRGKQRAGHPQAIGQGQDALERAGLADEIGRHQRARRLDWLELLALPRLGHGTDQRLLAALGQRQRGLRRRGLLRGPVENEGIGFHTAPSPGPARSAAILAA